MANTITGLVATLYNALGLVSQELTGFIPSVFINAEASRVAKGQELRYPVVGGFTSEDVTYGPYVTPDSGQTVPYESMTIQKEKQVTITWNGDEELGLGGLFDPILQEQFANAMREIVNEIEADGAALYAQASRAHGTAGTTPFQTAGDYTHASFLRKILVDNGSPKTDIKMVVDTTAGAYIRGRQGQYQMTGDGSFQRQGILYDMSGMQVRESAQIATHTPGTGTGYLVNNPAGILVGGTDIAVNTGSGTVVPGDVVTFDGGGSHNYIVRTGVSGAGTVVVNRPGARQVIADDAEMTIGASYVANMAFHRMAVHLLSRLPPMPRMGDSASEHVVITHQETGIPFDCLMYKQERQITYRIATSWGWKVVKPEWTAVLMG